MADQWVFVCYSQKDDKALEQVRMHLAPLARAGLIQLWADTSIGVGSEWRKEIERALDRATYAVLLISPSFLASDFIANVELPKLLTRQAAGELTLLPVFFKPSAVDQTPFLYRDASGHEKQRPLVDFQGIASPTMTLSEMSWSDRDRELVDLARQLRSVVSREKPRTEAGSAPPELRAEALPGRFELNVELSRKGDRLQLLFRRPAGQPFERIESSWSHLQQELEPIEAILDNYRPTRLQEWLSSPSGALAAGTKLSTALFGAADDPEHSLWRRLFAWLFQQSGVRPSPSFLPVRLRIQTDEENLLRLPWRLLAWKGSFLVDHGWVISTGPTQTSARNVTTDGRSDVLFVTGRGGDQAIEQLMATTRDAWKLPTGSDRLRAIRSADQLGPALAGMQPHWLVFAGDTEGRAEDQRLVFADGSKVSLAELASTFNSHHRPEACFLLGHGDGVAPAAIAGVPLVITRRLPDPVAASEFSAFLQRWLIHGDDPVAAACTVPRSTETITWHVVSDYGEWRTTPVGTPFRRDARLLLDRIEQKSRLLKEALELARPGQHLVLALVAHATAGSGLEHHAEQLVHELEATVANELAVRWLRLDLPPDLPKSARHLADQLLEQWGQVGDGPRHVLQREKPKARPGLRPVLFIDCGIHGASRGDAWRSQDFEGWLCFAAEVLAAHCPPEMRIIVYLALEVEAPSLVNLPERLHRSVDNVSLGSATSVVLLKALGQVPEEELRVHLRLHTACPTHRCGEAARLIFRHTQGHFDETVAMIGRGQHGWSSLLLELTRDASPQTAAVEDIF